LSHLIGTVLLYTPVLFIFTTLSRYLHQMRGTSSHLFCTDFYLCGRRGDYEKK
jgi:hypothetical protein